MAGARVGALGRMARHARSARAIRVLEDKFGAVRRRVPRAVWIGLAAVVGVYLLLVLVSNVLLRTSLLRNMLSSQPDTMHIDYASAWSPYPGRVIARDLTLRFQDSNVQFLLDIEHVAMTIDLFDLARQKFRAKSVDAEGTSFRMRHKLASAEGQEGRLAAYPPITGFPDPPVREPQPKPPLSDEEYDLWTIELEDVATSIRELWIMEYRYRGEGSVAGGMRLKPLRELWLPPCVIVTRGGVLSIGEQPILAGTSARVEVHVDPYDVRVPRGTAALRQLTARAEMEGQIESLAPFSSTYMRDLAVSLDGGRGVLKVNARVDHGLLHPESRVEWRTPAVSVGLPGGVAVRSDLAFVGHVEAGKGGATAALFDEDARPALVADVSLTKARVTLSSGKADDEKALATVADARATLSTANNDLTAPFPLSAAKLHVTSLEVPELARAAELLAPPDVDVKKGSLAATIRSSYRGGALDARADVTLADAHVVTESVDVASARGKAWAVATSKDLASGVSFGGSGLALEGVGLRLKDARASGLGISVDVGEGLLRTKKTKSVDASVGVRIVPGDEVLALGASLASLPKALGEAPAGRDAQAKLRVHAGGDGLDVRVLEAQNGALVARGRMRKPKAGGASGAFLLEVGPLRAGIEIAGGETHVKPFASSDWLEQRTR